MKQIINHTANSLSAIHGIALSVFVVCNTLLQTLLFPLLQTAVGATWCFIISVLIDATLYAVLYFIVKIIYDFIFIKQNKKFDLSGRWYHVHIPRQLGEIDYSLVHLSAGYTDISRDLQDFTFNGYNKHVQVFSDNVAVCDDYSTHWYTKAIKFADNNEFDLIQIYEAESRGSSTRQLTSCPCCKTKFDTPILVSDSDNYRYGIHTFKLFSKGVDGPCERIEAEFCDCWPSLKNGDLLFFRTEEERDECIKDYFRIANSRKQ
ncbi:MAG: hypothetical protein IJ996_02345 [Clostridia bacterium]|nr:hypothetical protein [Clostridia bacterium]